MRINVYSQELTSEVIHVQKESDGREVTGVPCRPRSAVTFWLPRSPERREEMARAFETIAKIFRCAPPNTGLD